MSEAVQITFGCIARCDACGAVWTDPDLTAAREHAATWGHRITVEHRFILAPGGDALLAEAGPATPADPEAIAETRRLIKAMKLAGGSYGPARALMAAWDAGHVMEPADENGLEAGS